MQSDSNCRHLQISYGQERQLPTVLLTTHIGSDADWLRKMLEVTTGFYIGKNHTERSVGMYWVKYSLSIPELFPKHSRSIPKVFQK